MNVFLRELKSNLKSLLIWSGIVSLFILLATAKFSAIAGDPEILKVLDDMPPALQDAFQMNAFNLTTLSGYFGLLFSYFALIASVFSVILGADIISKEERDKTVEFSLTMPITRQRLMTGKIFAAVVNCIVLMLVIWNAIRISTSVYEPEPSAYTFLFLCMIGIFIIQMIFLAVGVLLGSAMKQYKRADSTAVSLLLATYFFSITTDLSEKLNFLRFFTPFKYFNPLILLNESKFEMRFVWLSLGIIAVSYIGAYLSYSKRDLYI